jgi:hypothetical protein
MKKQYPRLRQEKERGGNLFITAAANTFSCLVAEQEGGGTAVEWVPDHHIKKDCQTQYRIQFLQPPFTPVMHNHDATCCTVHLCYETSHQYHNSYLMSADGIWHCCKKSSMFL